MHLRQVRRLDVLPVDIGIGRDLRFAGETTTDCKYFMVGFPAPTPDVRGDAAKHECIDGIKLAARYPRKESLAAVRVDSKSSKCKAAWSNRSLSPDRRTDMADVYGSSTTSTSTGKTTRIAGDDDVLNEGPGPEVMAADTLVGDDVINGLGDDLGTIRHIMIDVPSGRVAYAVLASGGFLGMGDKLFAIPWSALTLDTERKCFILNVSKEHLQAAPGFDKEHWPSMADPTWATEIHNYYGQPVYWRSASSESVL
jgi:sporulation protein YlmC with PRC-barrel domain